MVTVIEIVRATLLAALVGFAQLAAEDQTWLDRIDGVLRKTIGPPLKALHEPLDQWLGSLPMSIAMSCAIGLYVVAFVWVWCLKREFVFRGTPDNRWWRDLRIWATLVLIPYVAIYCVLGR